MLRRSAVAVAAVVLAVGAAACGGGDAEVSTDELAGRLKSEGDFSDLDNAALDCLAKAFVKHARASDLVDYVAGERDLDDITGDVGDEAVRDYGACMGLPG